MRRSIWPESLIQDAKYGLRTLRRSPGFTATAVLLLGLGIGANTAIFTLFNAALLRPLPFPDPGRLVLLWDDVSARQGPPRVEPTPADYVAWKQSSASFSGMAAFIPRAYNLTGVGEPEKLSGIRTTANLFTVLGLQPVLGRTLVQADDQPDAAPVVVLSERLWRSRFAADPGAIGRTISLDGAPHTVVGVVPPDFQFPGKDAVLWVPARFTPQELSQRGTYYFYVLARLKPGVTRAQAQAEMTVIARRLQQEFPRTNTAVTCAVVELHEHLTRGARPAMAVLLGAVGLVLFIAATNVANLLLVRNAGRRKELAVRRALGAGRQRLARQLVTESIVLAGAGAVLGVGLSTATFSYLMRLMPDGVAPTSTLGVDARSLLFTAGLAFLIVLTAGTLPALAAARGDLEPVLRAGGGRGATGSGKQLRRLLVVSEMALTVVLLVAAGLLLRSYGNVLAVEPGFNPHRVLVAETVLPPSKYEALQSRVAFYDGVLERVNAMPSVSSAAYANYPPLMFKGGRMVISIEGRPALAPADFARFLVVDRVVTAGYFSTLEIPVVRGREFDRRDGAGAPLSLVINEQLARKHWPNDDPIGHRIRIGTNARSDAPWYTIVGIVGDIRQMGLDVPAEPEMYFAANQIAAANATFLWPQHLVVRTHGDPLAISAAVRRAVWDVDSDEPVGSMKSMDQVFDTELLHRNTQLTLVGAFAILALVIASVGLYGVLSYGVTQQLREIAVKMALGARRASVVREIVRDALSLSIVGLALGLAAAFALTRLLAAWLFGVTATDPLTYGGIALLLVLTALGASCVPAWRGARVEPQSILRAE